ncbi:MAG TPA: hypothetical protein VMR31_09920 [Myxococcota bacterium]|nr:hypothetical protein [Myxococcota bacterium]
MAGSGFARGLVGALLFIAARAAAQTAAPPQIIGALVGPSAVKAQPSLAFWGADLGWTVLHKGELQILFGDTDATFDSVCSGQLHNDDSEGTLPLVRPATGVPPVTFLTDPNDPNTLQRLLVFRKGESLAMGYGQVPGSAYSDGNDLVAIVGRGGTIHCNAGASSPVAACRGPLDDHPEIVNWLSADGLQCTQALGECVPAPNGIPTACDLSSGAGCNATLGETCQPTPTGLCVDPSSSQNDGTPSSTVYTAANEMEFALQDPNAPGTYVSAATLRTNKFINAASRTVSRFNFAFPKINDYRPGGAAVLVWGRPGFAGEQGRQAQLYLLVHPLPIVKAADGRWLFHPWYYAGVDAQGKPIWSLQQANAKPLALDGQVGGSPHEEQPLVNQFSISWVGGTLHKWVMLYGGDIGDYLLLDPTHDRPGDGPGSVRIRFADDPWGPWSPAQPHLLEGAPDAVGTPLGPGGVLFSPSCVSQPGAPCVPSDPIRPIDSFLPGCFPFGKTFDRGFFYGSNIIDAYTELDGTGGMNIYWNVSTWNPYGVLFLRTNLRPTPH